MNAVLYPLSAVVAWLAFLFKLRDLRYSRDLALIMVLACFGFLGVVFTVSIPAVWSGIDRAVGYPNLDALISQSCVMLFGASQQALLLLWSAGQDPASVARARRRVLRRLIFTVATLAAMATLFFRAPRLPERNTDWVAQYAGQHDIAVYLLVYVGVFLLIQSELVYLALRYAERIGDAAPLLRRGLRLTAIGGCFGVLYALARLADVIGAANGLDPHKWETIPRLAAGIGEMFLPLGWTLPAWGPRAAAVLAWPKRWRDYHVLGPLWRQVRAAVPEVVLDQDEAGERSRRWVVVDLDYRLQSRVTEIRDGLRLLVAYHDPERVAQFERRAATLRLSDRGRSALVEFAKLEAAAAARRAGAPVPECAVPAAVHEGRRSDLVRLAKAGRSPHFKTLTSTETISGAST